MRHSLAVRAFRRFRQPSGRTRKYVINRSISPEDPPAVASLAGDARAIDQCDGSTLPAVFLTGIARREQLARVIYLAIRRQAWSPDSAALR